MTPRTKEFCKAAGLVALAFGVFAFFTLMGMVLVGVMGLFVVLVLLGAMFFGQRR